MFRTATISIGAVSSLVALAAAFPDLALAHDPPRGLNLVFASDSDPLPLVVVSNRGLVFADGMTHELSLRCNEAYGANTADHPSVAKGAAEGTFVIGVYDSVYTTSDRACTLESAQGLPSDPLGSFVQSVDDPARMYLATKTLQSQAVVLQSDDYGASWSTVFENEMSTYFDQLLVAPTDPARLYAAGRRTDLINRKLLYTCNVSMDQGKTFQEHVLDGNITPFAVHARNPDVVFGYEPTDALQTDFRVLRSEDQGATFKSVLEGLSQPTALLSGLKDSSVLLGAAGANGIGGLYVSRDDGLTFERTMTDEVQTVSCLLVHAGRLWMCANMAPNINGVWYSDDDGASFEQYMVFEDISQPVPCEGSALAKCAGPWYDFNTEVHPPGADAGAGDAGMASDAGAAETDAAEAGAPTGEGAKATDASAPDVDAGPMSTPESRPDGGCSAHAARDTSPSELLTLLLGLSWLVRRRRGEQRAQPG